MVLLESLSKMIQVGVANVLDAKSSTIRANMMGRHLCRQRPGVVAAL